MTKTIDLSKLADPFDPFDIEWRVCQAGRNNGKIYCKVLAYITARAIQSRLDDVCGPENWRNEPLTVHELKSGVFVMQVGISIRIGGEWITKWDVSEPTNIEPAKGGFSGAMKRAGAQWGIGRYLYHLTETFANVSEDREKDWNYAKLSDGGGVYYWEPPRLPGWALPKEPEYEISMAELKDLKKEWRLKFAPDCEKPAELREGFTRFVTAVVGEFPSADYKTWTSDAWQRCMDRIRETTDPEGPSADIPFTE